MIQLQLRKPKPMASKAVPPTKRPSPVPLPSQSLKKVKEETDWYSSDQYRMREMQWYDNGEEWEEVPEEALPASVPVKIEEAASSAKGKSSAPASGSKGKGKHSGHRSGWFNKMAILLARMQRGEWQEVKLLTTAQLGWQ